MRFVITRNIVALNNMSVHFVKYPFLNTKKSKISVYRNLCIYIYMYIHQYIYNDNSVVAIY
jgi:hypothetical protein